MNVIQKESTARTFLDKMARPWDRVLNIGSASRALGNNTVNLDIEILNRPNLVGDAHHLPFASGSFNVCVAAAVLQYCKRPDLVAKEIARVLAPMGMIIIEAPFIQQYCYDSPDLFRFTRDGLISLFKDDFIIVRVEPSIAGGSALAFYLQGITDTVENKYLRFAVRNLVSFAAWPISFMKFNHRHEIAGAFTIIANKK